MISVYYNQKYGFLIVPNAIERFMGCYISIEPTIEIMAEETIDKIGCAIRKGIKIAESSPKVDESQLNNFWKQTKYKSFPTFSKNYQRIDLKQNGDELEIRRWERNNRGGYSRKTEEKDYTRKCFLTSDTTKGALNVDIHVEIPVAFADKKVLDSIRATIISNLFGDDFIAHPNDSLVLLFTNSLQADYRDNNAPLVNSLDSASKYSFNNEHTVEGFSLLSDKKIYSYGIDRYVFMGGAHGLSNRNYFNFDLKTGKLITEKELYVANYQTALSELIKTRIIEESKEAKGKDADPIIVHPAVRNMLLTQKSFAEAGRALVYLLSLHADTVEQGATEEERKASDNILSLLTPIAKAFLTETGSESAKHGVQVFGGHGFISEHGMEQIVRDTRISCLYEGTTEIQALDLLGRKVLGTQGAMLKDFTKIIHKFAEANKDNEAMKEFVEPLAALNKEWGDLTMQIGMRAMQNPEEVGAAAVDYLYFSGYVTLAYLWARMALTAQEALAAGTTEVDFYNAKVTTARFYFKKILPRVRSHVEVIAGGLEPLMSLDAEHFAF